MDMEIKDIERLEFRKERLLEKSRRLESLISGRSVSLMPLIRTKTGKHSEKRTWLFINALTDALEKYEKYRNLEEEPDFELSPEERTFYKSFLYCAIRIAEEKPWWLLMSEGTFDDILKLAENTLYHAKHQLHFYELYKRPALDGFFFYMDELYELFTGTAVTLTIDEEELSEVKRLYASEIEFLDSEDPAYLEEYEKAFAGMSSAEITLRELDALSPAQMKEGILEAQRDAKEQEEKQKWAEHFSEKELFCSQYLLCRKLYFETGADHDFPRRIERMTDIYLYEHEISSFLNDELFFSAYAMLRRALRYVDGLMEESPHEQTSTPNKHVRNKKRS